MTFTSSDIKKVSWLIILLSVCSISPWSVLPINRYIEWGINFSLLFYAYLYFKNSHAQLGKDYYIVIAFLIWMIIGCIRGLITYELYMDLRWLTEAFQMLSLPIFVFLFSSPRVNKAVLQKWSKYGFFIFFLYIIWVVPRGAYHFYLAPVYLFGIFAFILPNKWRILLLVLLILMTTDLGARAQVIKSVMTIIFAIGFMARKMVSTTFLTIIQYLLYGLTVALLLLGISGTFNIFQDLQKHSGKYSQKRIVNGKVEEEDIAIDTRTFIYVEVIESALRHKYILAGRTPARGNDEFYFNTTNKDKNGNIFRKNERHYNELCFPNIFTWLGIIGMTLYSFIYIKASILAMHKSNNVFVKFLAVFIAFRWMLGWIEDTNSFSISNISLWMIIAICYSPYFRRMNNHQFKVWLYSCLNHKK